jgi:transketolase
MKYSETNSGHEILISKGHAAAALYSVMNTFGIIPDQEIEKYCQNGGVLGGHVSASAPFDIPLSTGSLGHALSFGVGLAIAKTLNKQKGKVFVLGSDGECDSGSNWEAAMLAAHRNLSNLIFIIDRNRLQSIKSTEDTIMLEPLKEKWVSFNWNVLEINGHDLHEIKNSLDSTLNGPLLIIANTIKGKGVSFMENRIEWHYKSPDADTLSKAISELI